MLFASHWKCHSCQHIFTRVGYVEHPLCHHRRCGAYNQLALRKRSSNHTPPHRHSECTSSNITSSSRRDRENQPAVITQHSETASAPRSSLGTDIYICCQCDSEGPQVWQHNILCSGCGHLACRYCQWFE